MIKMVEVLQLVWPKVDGAFHSANILCKFIHGLDAMIHPAQATDALLTQEHISWTSHASSL